jgi:hypothetical protein
MAKEMKKIVKAKKMVENVAAICRQYASRGDMAENGRRENVSVKKERRNVERRRKKKMY